MQSNRWLLSITLPILVLLLIAPFTPWIDLTISQYVYNRWGFIELGQHPLMDWLFYRGQWPAFIVVGLAIIGLLLSRRHPQLARWKPHFTALILSLAIGAGLITHLILKDHWGRPRPRQVIEFGGTEPFRPFYSPNFSGDTAHQKSFSCGHCSVGFFFFTTYLIARKEGWRKTSYAFLGLALLLGIGLSITRILQGGHFFSDTVVTALIMWITAVVMVEEVHTSSC